MTADKRKAEQEKLDKANADLDQIQGERDKAVGDANIDAYKATEPKGGRGGRESGADSAARGFGSSFMGGLAQSLGFPDVFGGKAPWDFGAVKMLGGFANYVMSGLHFGEGSPQGAFPNMAAGAAAPFGIPTAAFNPTANAPVPTPVPQAPGLPYAAPVIGAPPTAPGPTPGPQMPVHTPKPSPGHGRTVADHGTPQIPAGAPGSIVPYRPPPTPGPTSPTPQTVPADFSGPNLYGYRYDAGFPDGHGGRMAAPQGAPWASAASSLTTMALGFASKMVPNIGSIKGGQPAGFQMPGTGGGSGGDGGQGQPLGATGIMQTTGSVPTFYGGGDTHTHNYGDTHNHIDNSTTWNVSPKNDASMVQHLREHQNAQRSNAALASAPGTLMSYP
jgi:hypothetical protein